MARSMRNNLRFNETTSQVTGAQIATGKRVCAWLRRLYYCWYLTAPLGLAWVLLNKICKPFFALFSVVHGESGRVFSHEYTS